MPVPGKINIRQLLKLVRTAGVETSTNALLELCIHYNKLRDKHALTYATQALEQAVTINSPGLIAASHLQLAIYFCRTQNDYFASMRHCEKALSLKNAITSKREQADIYKITGFNYHYMGDLEKAQQQYRHALNILLSISEKNEDVIKDIADLYYNLAILNRSEENAALRKEYLEQAEKFYRKIDHLSGIARCADGMAVYYYYMRNSKKALEQLHVALKIFQQVNDTDGIYLTYNNIGTVKLQAGKFDEALDYLHKSLEQRKKSGNPVSIAISYINIANAWIDQDKHAEALTYLKKAEKLLRKSEGKIELASLLLAMSKCYAALGRHDKAYEALTEYVNYRQELHKFELQKAYSDTKLHYDIELMEKDAVIDRLQNFEIASYVHRLEISNNELRQFAHAASHDLKEPLRTITGFATLLEKNYKGKIDETGIEYLGYITTAAKRLNELVKDILDLSKINITEAQLSEVDLNEVYQEVMAHIQLLVKERNVEVKCGKLPVITADKSQMFQLFMNLMVNGIKYNNSAKPVIQVKAVKESQHYKLSFADNGIGIPEQYRDKVFEIFQRLHHREKYSGTGIGLTLCKKIVDRHKGRIWVEKNIPHGSVFYVTLPIQ